MKKYAVLLAMVVILLTACSQSTAGYSEESAASSSHQEISSLPKETASKAETETTTYEQVSQENEFIDFEYVREYSGSTDRSSVEQLASKAEGFLLKNDALHVNMEKLDLTDENMADYIDENGRVKPVFQVASTEDFDGDGESESFFIVTMPKSDSPAGIRSYLFFAGGGEVELVNEYFYV